MAQGFEVDWDALDRAGSRFLEVHDDLPLPVVRRRTGYGSDELQRAAVELQEAWERHVAWLVVTTDALGSGLRSSARWYSEADAVLAAERFGELSQ